MSGLLVQFGQANAIDRLCTQLEARARAAQAVLWHDTALVRSYGLWATSVLRAQCQYQRRVGAEQHALLHRVHRITTYLFGLTALGAALHLVWHSLWLSLVTVFSRHWERRCMAHWRNRKPFGWNRDRPGSWPA